MKTVVITGASAGIGSEIPSEILKKGHTVVSNTRKVDKAEIVKKELKEKTANENIYIFEGNFASFKSVKKFTSLINEKFSKIDIYLNNAGTLKIEFIETEDKIETNFQVNHLSPMLITLEILKKFKKSDNARIIITSSASHKRNIFEIEAGISGRYIFLESEYRQLSPFAKDSNYAEKLWNISMKYIGRYLTENNSTDPNYKKT